MHILALDMVVGKYSLAPVEQPELNPIHARSANTKPAPFEIVLVISARANCPVLLVGGIATLLRCIAFESWWQIIHSTEQYIWPEVLRKTMNLVRVAFFIQENFMGSWGLSTDNV